MQMDEREKKESPIPAISIAQQMPFVYADKVIDVALGAYVSRVAFGMEVSQTQTHPVITVGISTLALIDFCRNFLAQVQAGHVAINEKIDIYKNRLDELDKINISPKKEKKK
jgi:hypothetical protein